MLFRQLEILGLLALTGSVSAVPHRRRQDGGAPTYSPDQSRADAVKEAFQFGWDGYMEHAFPHDSLKPVENGYEDDRYVNATLQALSRMSIFFNWWKTLYSNGWGATAIDALSTAIIMGNRDAVDSILDHISKVDFTFSEDDVSFFETTIRYLAGMLSGKPYS